MERKQMLVNFRSDDSCCESPGSIHTQIMESLAWIKSFCWLVVTWLLNVNGSELAKGLGYVASVITIINGLFLLYKNLKKK